MPDRPSPISENQTPYQVDSAQSRLFAESQNTAPQSKATEIKGADQKVGEIKGAGTIAPDSKTCELRGPGFKGPELKVPVAPHVVSPEALYSGIYGSSVRIPPFAKLETLVDNETWKHPNKLRQDQAGQADTPPRPRPFKENPYSFDKIYAEAMRKANESPFTPTCAPLLVPSGLGPYTIGMLTPGSLGTLNRGLGGGVVAGIGAFQAYRDYQNLLNADNSAMTAKNGLALSMDAGMVSGGLLGMTKFGPKWLGPTLLLGGVAGRMALDLIPNSHAKAQ